MTKLIHSGMIFFLLFLFTQGSSSSNDSNLFFEHPVQMKFMINDFIQDLEGFFWIATQNGLYRYDGFEIKPFKKETHKLSGNWIESVFEDKQGIIWIGIRNGGLNKYDKETGSISVFRHSPDNPESIRDNTPLCIAEGKEDVLWVGTENGGLNKFNKKTGSFSHYLNKPNVPHSINSNWITSVLETRDGTLWVGTNKNGLNRFYENTGSFIHYQHNPSNSTSISDNQITRILEDSKGNLWIGTREGGLNRCDAATGTFTAYKHDPDDPKSLAGDFIQEIYEDPKGVIWIGHLTAGISKHDPVSDSFIRYKKNQAINGGLLSDDVKTIYVDRSGILWVACTSGQIEKHAKKTKPFHTYRHEPENPESLSSNFILSILEDQYGEVWLGTAQGCLNKYNRKTNNFIRYKPDPENPAKIQHHTVVTTFEDSSGTFWISTTNLSEAGLSIFDRTTGKIIKTYQHDPSDRNSLGPGPIVRKIIQDNENPKILWIFIDGYGFDRFNMEKETFGHFAYDPRNHSLGKNIRVWDVLQDQGSFWLATEGRGLNKFEKKTGHFLVFMNDTTNPNSIISNSVHSIYEDKKGFLWLGTDSGLEKFNQNNGIFFHYSISNGLPDNLVYGILEDGNQNLWISTGNGLVKFNPESETFRIYNHDDGLQGDAFFYTSHLKTKDGEMWFGGLNGVSRFDPKNISDNPNIPPIVLTSITQGGEDMLLNKSPSRLKKLNLKWHHNYFDFKFAALEYTNPSKNHFKYMMEGYDQKWSEPGPRRSGGYTNIPGGRYILKIVGSNNDGVWNEKGVALDIVVEPPFWKTFGFITLLSLVCLSLIIFVGLYFIKLNMEVKKRKKVDEQLKINTEEHKAVLEASPNPVVVYDVEGRTKYVNPSFTRVFGWTLEELIGTKIDFVPEDQKEATMAAIKEVMNSESKRIHFETKRHTKNGKILDLHLSAAVYTSNAGAPMGMVVNFKNITEQKSAEEEKKKLESQLQQAQKMESIGTLAGGIAHDFNNILSAILGYSELSMVDADRESPLYKNLSEIAKAGERARELVKQILTFSRQTKQEHMTIQISPVIKETLKLLRASLPATIAIRSSLKSKLTVLADPTQIHQVLMNLCTNASHAMLEKGGILEVRLEDTDLDSQFVKDYPELKAGPYVNLTISDTGHGIDPAIMERIFDPFFTTKERGKGTGMGLSVVHGIVKSHKGIISVDSNQGIGTVFSIYIPAINSEASQKLSTESPLPTGTERILFVDDEEFQSDLGKQILERLGYPTTIRTNSLEALDCFRENPDDFDLVMTDMTMPNMTGVELAKKILEIRPGIPIIICTGYSEQITEEKAREIGIKGFAMKPIVMKKIARLIRSMLD